MTEWINAKAMGMPKPKKAEPFVDKAVSKIVGKTIAANDPRLMAFVVEKKRQNTSDTTMDNMLQKEENREELKQIFN